MFGYDIILIDAHFRNLIITEIFCSAKAGCEMVINMKGMVIYV